MGALVLCLVERIAKLRRQLGLEVAKIEEVRAEVEDVLGQEGGEDEGGVGVHVDARMDSAEGSRNHRMNGRATAGFSFFRTAVGAGRMRD